MQSGRRFAPTPALGVAALTGGLVGYSWVTNRVLDGDRWYTSRHLGLAAGLVALGRAVGLSWEELGLGAATTPRSRRWAGRSAAVVAAGVGLTVASASKVDAIDDLLADERAGRSWPVLARQALVRIPLGTALFEEVAFRGVLFGLATRTSGTARAAAISSAVFGLWHVGPTLAALETNDRPPATTPVVTSVAASAAGGVLLSWLRAGSGGLLAPTVAHWAINSLGLLAAAAHQRRCWSREAG